MSSRLNELAKKQLHFIQSSVLGKACLLLLVVHANNGLDICYADSKLYGEYQLKILLRRLVTCLSRKRHISVHVADRQESEA